MKIAVISDIHLGIRSNNQFFQEHSIQFFENIFIPYLLENKIDTILFAGDMTDNRKQINFVTLNVWKKRLFNVLEKHNFKIHAIPGNHDLSFRNSREIDS